MRVVIKLFLIASCLFCGSVMAASHSDSNDLSKAVGFYELTDIIDLGGKTLTLTDDLTILFKGGMISNGAIQCRNTTFIGTRGLRIDVTLKGSVSGPVNLNWYQLKRDDPSFDIGPVVNRVSSEFSSIEVPEGTFYFKTPIVIKKMKSFILNGNLVYNGKERDVTAISFVDCVSSTISLNGSVRYDQKTDVIRYTRSNMTNIVGLDFVNTNQSDIKISDVRFFNNNIRVSGRGAGNAYNQFRIGISYYSNIHLRIFQEDVNGKIGWCNENIFFGGRYGNPSTFDQSKSTTTAIHIEGNPRNDSYDKSNSLLFIKPCTEGFKTPSIYAKNVQGCQWLYGRNENSGVYIKFVGKCRDNEVKVSYGPDKIDYSECETYPLAVDSWYPIVPAEDSKNDQKSAGHVYVLDTRQMKRVMVRLQTAGRISIEYLDKDGKLMEEKFSSSNGPRPLGSGSFYYMKKERVWKNGSDATGSSFSVPDNVYKIRVSVSGSNNSAQFFSAD